MYNRYDTVRVKSFEEISKTLKENNLHKNTASGLYFAEAMKKWCGKELRVLLMVDGDRVSTFENQWSWHLDWIEPLEIDNRRVANV